MTGLTRAMAIAASLLATAPLIAADKQEDAAQSAAESWLKLVDDEKYEASWDQAAPYFKETLTKAQWAQAVRPVRAPLGKLVSRKVKSRQYTEEVFGAPEGKYVIIQFDASFQGKASAVETVTTMLDRPAGGGCLDITSTRRRSVDR